MDLFWNKRGLISSYDQKAIIGLVTRTNVE
jgi:hypothetical protein